MRINYNVFRAYDIRGIYPNEINEDFAFILGKAFGTFIKGKIVVGRDVRIGGEKLKEKFIEGALSTGCDVIDVDLATTPIIIFCTGYYKLDGGVMITASHNPKEYNGFKFYKKNAIPISFESGLNKILEIFKKGKFNVGSGTLEKKDILKDYSNYLLKHIKIKKPVKMKIVIDAGNGSAGVIYPKIFKKLGIKVIELFTEPDGNFPNRNPDPSKEENLKALKEKVVQTKADIGFAYDTDADRIAVVDENGNVVDTKNIFSILIKHILSNNPNEKVVYDILSSRLVHETILANKGVPVICRTGHSYITQKFIEENAILGGELSGHYYFRETFGGEDTLFASLKIIEYLKLNKQKLSEAIKEFPDYYIEEFRIKVPDSKKFKIVEKIKSDFVKKGVNVNTLDGIKIFFDDGWIAFRPSNTAPQIVVAYEGFNKESFEKMKNITNEIIRKYKVGIP
jgi:phosphomannomutase